MFAGLAVVIVSVGTFLPHLGVIQLLAVVPFAITGLRNRARAIVAAAIAAAFVAFLVAGAIAALVIAGCAVLGGLCGIIRRHGRGSGTVALVAAGLAPVSAAAALGVLSLLSGVRDLALGSLRAGVAGTVRVAESAGVPVPVGHAVVGMTDSLLRAWPIVVAAVVIVAVPAGMLLTNVPAAVARRVEWLANSDPLDHAARAECSTRLSRRCRCSSPASGSATADVRTGRARGCRSHRGARGVRRGRRSQWRREVHAGVTARRRATHQRLGPPPWPRRPRAARRDGDHRAAGRDAGDRQHRR